MKFAQLIAYNTRNIFPEKAYTNRGGETNPFLKNHNLANLWINCLKRSTFCFRLYAKLRISKSIETKL